MSHKALEILPALFHGWSTTRLLHKNNYPYAVLECLRCSVYDTPEYNFDQHAIQIFNTETGFKQHAKTQVTMFGFEVEIKPRNLKKKKTSEQTASMRHVG